MFGTNQREPFFFLMPVVFASLVLCQFLIICIITSQKTPVTSNTANFVFLWDSGIECNFMWKWYCCDHVEVKSTAVECFSDQVKPLIWIESVIEKHSHSRIEYMIKVRSSKIIMATFSLLSHLFSVLGQQCMYFCTNI